MPVLITVHSLPRNDGDVWVDKPWLELTRSRYDVFANVRDDFLYDPSLREGLLECELTSLT